MQPQKTVEHLTCPKDTNPEPAQCEDRSMPLLLFGLKTLGLTCCTALIVREGMWAHRQSSEQA